LKAEGSIQNMQRLLTLSLLAIATVAGAPSPSDAQVYPERIRTVVRHKVDAYQRRDDSREEQVERYTKTVRIGAAGELDVSNIAGDITVTRGAGNDATIEVVKTARARTAQDARDLLPLVQVDIIERAGRAEVRTQYPTGDTLQRNNRRNINVSVAFNITAPSGTRVTVKSISGTVKVTDIKGDVSADSISGDVRISGSGRIGSAKSVSGTVEVSDTKVDGALVAGSISGDVVLRRLTAQRIDTNSISGGVRLEDVQCDRIGAQSISGGIDFSGPLARNGRYSLKSHSGEIRIAIAGGSGFEVEASSFSGEVRTELPITTHGAPATNRGRQRVLTGTYGDGSAFLELTTFSGSIVIAKR
jgi:DUF4097 and DUF4098 domain-containing protein YvlB